MTTHELRRLEALARHSVRLILDHQAASGGYLASPSFPVYRYSWFRDGAFIANAMSRAGQPDSAERFFDWCSRILVERAPIVEDLIRRHRAGEAIADGEYLHARYTVAGEEAEEDWWTFQLDGYGTWLWALGAHARRHGGSTERWAPGVEIAVRYLAELWPEPCYDWWEEHRTQRHTSTLAAIRAGLDAAAGWSGLPSDVRSLALRATAGIDETVRDRGIHEGRLTKWLDGTDLDASLIACATPFELVDPRGSVAARTVSAIEATLAHRGVHRYGGDVYYGGGEWLLLAGLLGWHYASVGRSADAEAQLAWIVDQASATGDLPEQVSDHLLHPDRFDEWLDRWGPVATPLLWSHAMLLTLALEVGTVRAPVIAEPPAAAT